MQKQQQQYVCKATCVTAACACNGIAKCHCMRNEDVWLLVLHDACVHDFYFLLLLIDVNGQLADSPAYFFSQEPVALKENLSQVYTACADRPKANNHVPWTNFRG